MNEKELLEQIRQSAETVTPPDALSPDSIEKMLREQAASEGTPNIGRKKSKFSVYRLGTIAAVFVLALVGVWAAASRNWKFKGTKSELSESQPVQTPTQPLLSAAPTSETVSEDTAKLPAADSYETVYQALRDKFYYYDEEIYYDFDTVYEESARDMGVTADAYASEDTSVAADSNDLSHSETNVQEIGVDEGDFVKTDGKFIYILKRTGSFLIVSADQGELEIVSSIKLPISESVKEMYVDGDYLSVITTVYYTSLDTSTEGVYASSSNYRTTLYTYSIADREKPELIGTISQDGNFSQSRKNGDYIYLFTQYSPDIQSTYEESSIIPRTSRGELSASQIYLPEHLTYSTYLVASSVNTHEPGEIGDQKAVVSVASTFYASEKNIYIANEVWSGSDTRTELMKLHYENGRIYGAAAGSVEGYLNDSFSLNEYNGYLRVVTTSYDENYDERNGLYILDENLVLTGAIRNLAQDETIRSARFLGDTGYFVTFRQTDPLFSADLSDPADPKILGALKISGFASYLHFYNDHLLLGLGYESNENTGERTGLKLSMFDISDPSNVKEVSKFVLNGITWCSSLDNYRSILIDPEKNLFGFTCDNRYLLFSYDEEKGFVKEFIYDFYNDIISQSLNDTLSEDITIEEESSLENDWYYDNYDDDSVTRGIYIGDTLYLVRPGAITAFDMGDNYKEIGRLFLN